jgi:hypothetical protein
VILVDTTVWIDHFRRDNATLARLLNEDQVLGHPFVVGELALGNLPRRTSLLRDLGDLPASVVATHGEAMVLLEAERLYGLGIGYVDLHLLAATRLAPGTRLWSRDVRLANVAGRLGLSV